MSNVEIRPAEVGCGTSRTPAQILTPRSVPLGGPRAMNVRRTLPQRKRTLIGAWCFVDHYGPDDVAATGGMRVPGHPHTGLQTVSWLFRGEIEHLDTTGARGYVRPGEVNVMTAGAGIAHSEYSTPSTTVLHGVQLWVALPDAHRATRRLFEHQEPPPLAVDGAHVVVLVGALSGYQSPITTFSPLLGAEVTIPPDRTLTLEIDPTFEHGVLIDAGQLSVDELAGRPGDLLYLPPGRRSLKFGVGSDGPARLLLLGGEPLGEQIIMWWNFVGRSHEEIVEYRSAWQAERRGRVDDPRFGTFPDAWSSTLPAPELPNGRLRLRS